MLSTSEKTFIKNWEIQKEGARWKYYLQYIIAWTVVIFLSLFFIIKLIIADRAMGGWIGFVIIFAVSMVLATVVTHLIYKTNEKKFERLLKRIKD